MNAMNRHNALSAPAALRRVLLLTGAALTLTAVVHFFAWNWHALSGAARFALTGGGTVLCLLSAAVADRKGRHALCSLSLFAAALFTGLFWIVFGQIFQSAATFREFCLAWAAGTIPLFLLRRTALLWNLLVLLLSAGSCADPLLTLWEGAWTPHLLPPLLVAAACCAVAMLPPGFLRRPPGLNAWLTLPLTLLLAEATVMCAMLMLLERHQYHASLPEAMAGPLALAAVLVSAVRARHVPALCETALCGIVLLNTGAFRLSDSLSLTERAALFTLLNGACAFLLLSLLSRLPRWKTLMSFSPALAHVPALFGGLLSALSLMALTALFFSGLDASATLLRAGLLYMICGTLLWRHGRTGTFSVVLASVLVTGGSLCFHIGLLEYTPAVILAAVWTAALLLYALLDYPPLRFSAVFWAIVSTIIFLPDLPVPDAFLSAGVFFLCFLPLSAAAAGRFPRSFLRPASLACLCALLLLCPTFPPVSSLCLRFGTAEETFCVTLAALNLAVLFLRRLHTLPSLSGIRPADGAAAVAVILVLWMLAPLETLIGLNLLFAGMAQPGETTPDATDETAGRNDRTLMLLGVLALAAHCLLFYYLTVFPFRMKMAYVGLPGLCLLAAGLRMTCPSRAPDGKKKTSVAQPAPGSLLPFALCAAVLAVLFCTAVADRKALLREGEEVLLSLAPQDPRAFLFGDYMALSYDVDRLPAQSVTGPGCLPLVVDDTRVAHASPDGVLEGSACTDVSVPALTVDRTTLGTLRLRLPRRCYMEEGSASVLERARYAVLRFDDRNRMLLTGLADEDGRPIRPVPDAESDDPVVEETQPDAERRPS